MKYKTFTIAGKIFAYTSFSCSLALSSNLNTFRAAHKASPSATLAGAAYAQARGMARY